MIPSAAGVNMPKSTTVASNLPCQGFQYNNYEMVPSRYLANNQLECLVTAITILKCEMVLYVVGLSARTPGAAG